MPETQSPEDFLPEYYEICDVLIAEDSMTSSAAELHGLLCGYLAAGARFSHDAWLKLAMELTDITEFRHESSKLAFTDLYDGVVAQLEQSDFSFQLLLPDDDLSMAERAEALGCWCQGYLSGFGLQGGHTNESLSSELKEALADMAQIAQIELEPDADEDNEADLMELQEYVRISSMMIYGEFNAPPEQESASGATLH
ncbi:UPF0149 family protein [Amphritea sp. 2_MG-2023]|uniref:UPF0149 family protein n=1 Tax=Amphritea TaxID=515417 RepID=UPI001C065D52|nr:MULTISPECIES: UPF0149 family protein [Amphritea]MBU2967154.1 UPF0149 family protein [Amphritea atlantica]MDO6419293.1 UPF0149 family protein [Amphritea sp. 2_MG-2023]